MGISLGGMYSGFKPQNNAGVSMPPVGSYVCEIQAVKVEKNPWREGNDLVIRMEICEGEYTGIFKKIYEDQKSRFDNVMFKGDFRLSIPSEESESWHKRSFERSMWCIEDSNNGYFLNPDAIENLRGKKVGATIREREYRRDGEIKTVREIAFLESVKDVQAGNVYAKHYEKKTVPHTVEEQGFVQVEEGECPF